MSCNCCSGTFPEGPQGVQGPAGLDGTEITYVATDAAVAGIATPAEGDVAVVTSNGNEYEYVSGVWTARLKNMWQTATLGATGSGADVEAVCYNLTIPSGIPISSISGEVRYRFINDTFIYQVIVNDLDIGISSFNEITFDFTNILTGVTVPAMSAVISTIGWDGDIATGAAYAERSFHHHMDTSQFVHMRTSGNVFADAGTLTGKTPPNGMNITGIVKITY